jgi:hypothetical protein
MVMSKYQNKGDPTQFLLCCSFIVIAVIANPSALAQDSTNEQRNAGGNEYKPCIAGPQMLRATDEWELHNRKKASVTINGKSMLPETAAEMFISDCSQQLAVVSGMAATEDGTAFKMVRNAWNENLEFMKWWLQNRRQKAKPPIHKK